MVTITDLLQNKKAERILIGGGFNAKSTIWGNNEDDNRGIRLTNLLNNLNICIGNNGYELTFTGPLGNRYIDLTCTNYKLFRELSNWGILDQESLSDHKLITWGILTGESTINNNHKDNKIVNNRFCSKKANWIKFEETFTSLSIDLENMLVDENIDINTNAEKLNEIIINSCKTAMPQFKRFAKSVRWWTI